MGEGEGDDGVPQVGDLSLLDDMFHLPAFLKLEIIRTSLFK
jgi:hypothetical protein